MKSINKKLFKADFIYHRGMSTAALNPPPAHGRIEEMGNDLDDESQGSHMEQRKVRKGPVESD